MTHRINQRVKVNRASAKRQGAPAAAQGRAVPTAFLARHVAHATTVREILRAALKGIEEGRKAKSFDTQLLYRDRFNLELALSLADDRGI